MQKLTEYQELLTITMEECGELIQACSKALRRQDIDDQNLRDEIGDVMCMIELMQEWDVVGLVGKLRMHKGQPTNPNWREMRDISDAVEEWLVR